MEPEDGSTNQGTADEAIQLRRIEGNIRRLSRFAVEFCLLWGLGLLVWWASHIEVITEIEAKARFSGDDHTWNLVFAAIWTPFLIYSSVAFTLFLIIFYGTSYQLTPFRILMPFLRGSALGSYTKGISPELHEATLSKERETPDPVFAPSQPSSVEASQQYGEREEEQKSSLTARIEVIDDILHEAGRSTTRLAQRMENRINLHLTFGVLTGGVGLAVWYMTFYHGTVPTPATSETIGGRLVDALPRITILFFIELLAGFFLRQYRIGVEDLKYFLELRRRAEFKRIAYLIYERVNSTEAKLAFAKQLLEERSDTRLSAGEMTTTLYAIDKEKNEFISGLQAVTEKIQSVAKELKEAKAVKK